ncbi:unnamed protein product [Orchesella dallaii]|uniref:Spaetzle domain-containing protein n=1 Tax=Orchesella dallaii TaxID=48710 RepID=A0ABP1RXY4_9HEXA
MLREDYCEGRKKVFNMTVVQSGSCGEGVRDCDSDIGAPEEMEGEAEMKMAFSASGVGDGCSKCGGVSKYNREEERFGSGVDFIVRLKKVIRYRRRKPMKMEEEEEELSHQNSRHDHDNLIPKLASNLRASSSSSWTFFLASVVIIIIILQSVSQGSFVSAIDLTPHGGIYHQRDEFSFASTASISQSEYGGAGDDMIMTCSRPTKSSRAAKYLAIKQLDIPCDMADKKAAWCNLPGDKYPWHAVRRFVFENQGLMRRMYGEVRQLSLLRMEFEDDLDDELEEERRGPPRAPPLPEDHRRNSILTEIFDESLPRVLSQSPPEDQLLLRDHNNLINIRGSTPRTFPSVSSSSSSTSEAAATSETEPVTSSSATPQMFGGNSGASSSSEEMLRIMNGVNNETTATTTATEVTIPSEQVTTDSVATTSSELNGTTTSNTVVDLGGETGSPVTSGSVRSGVAVEEVVVTEEATQSTTSGVTETENNEEEQEQALAQGGGVVTTTEEIVLETLSEDEQVVDQAPVVEPMGTQQQLNDGLEIGGMGSDESHDFLNLDKNHILYFDDVGKNRRPVGGGGGGGGGDQYLQPPPQHEQQQPPSQGKLKAVNACPVKEEVVAPYWANNTRGEILALLNLYPFEQYIHWERCNHENKQMFCRQGCRCEQQYRLHRLLAFDPTNECRGIFSDWFRFPSCCVCRCYLNEYELMMLNAAGQDNPPPPSSAGSPKSRTSDRIRSPRKILLEQLVDGPDVHGVDDIHFFYKQGFNHEHNHGAQPRRKRREI